MKIGIISFSSAGEKLSQIVENGLKKVYCDAEFDNVCKSKYAVRKLEISHGQWAEERFADSEALIFIGACGIAVRTIAPLLKSKQTDPAVVVMDDCGKFSIPLLSGHLGGANELAKLIAKITGATAAVTTATDNHKKLSPDIFAQRNNCEIGSMVKAKELAAWLLEGNSCGIYSDFEVDKDGIPSEVQILEKGQLIGSQQRLAGEQSPANEKLLEKEQTVKPNISEGIRISVFDEEKADGEEKAGYLHLIPRAAYVGIGCKRGTSYEAIEETFRKAIKECNLSRRAIAAICSCDLKKDEKGLMEFCKRNGFDFVTFSSEHLMSIKGDFTKSAFVKSVTGADNVCERSAAAGCIQAVGSDEYEFILRKYCGSGVTCAVAIRKWRISFE